MFLLTKKFEFSAAHRLHTSALSAEENQKVFGACNNLYGHGHNYEVEITLRAKEYDPNTGMVMNLSDLGDLINRKLFPDLDHKHLNHDVPWLKGLNPTAEVLARAIWERIDAEIPGNLLYRVVVWESRKNVVEYYGRGQ